MTDGGAPADGPGFFTSVDGVSPKLAKAGYLASTAVATTIFSPIGSASRCW